MMSARSFLVTRQNQRLPSPASSPPRAPLSAPSTAPSFPSLVSSSFALFRRKDDQPTRRPIPTPQVHASPRITTTASVTTTAAVSPKGSSAMMADRRTSATVLAASPSPSSAALPNPVQTVATLVSDRPTTPTSPVQIPIKSSREHETAHTHAGHHHRRDRGSWRHMRKSQHGYESAHRASREMHGAEAIPPSVAALLAATSIPSPRSARSLRQGRNSSNSSIRSSSSSKRLTVDAIIDRAQEVEQEFSLSLSKSPLDVLLTAPEDLEDDDEVSISDSTVESALSTRTVSLESMPSLTDSFATGTIPSVETPFASSRGRGIGRKARPQHRSPTPVSSPPGKRLEHPLSVADADNDEVDVDSLDFRVFQPPSPADPLAKANEARFPLQPIKSAFKSNLTASLRALRNAARSFSGFNLASSIPPEDFLTRSILTIDPRIPYTDERRPPPLEEEPSAALRRYLNPTSSARLDSRQPTLPHQQQQQQQQQQQLLQQQQLSPALASASLTPLSRTVSAPLMSMPALPTRSAFTASIQMQTYKVRRMRIGATSPPSNPSRSLPTPPASPKLAPRRGSGSSPNMMDEWPFPGPRQRELRENSDFIRIAVMEMTMRRAGKLDDRKPGRARLALPPRQTSTQPYVVGADGVPARWVGLTPDNS